MGKEGEEEEERRKRRRGWRRSRSRSRRREEGYDNGVSSSLVNYFPFYVQFEDSPETLFLIFEAFVSKKKYLLGGSGCQS